MQKIIFEFKPGTFVPKGITAQVCGEIMQDLESRNALTPKNLVDMARSESSPIHAYFEWNDTVAAEKYRQEQARYLIRHIVSRTITPEQTEPTRVFHAITHNHSAATPFRNVVSILSEEKSREALLKQAVRDAKAFKAKYAQLNELANVFSEIDKLTVVSMPRMTSAMTDRVHATL